MVHRSVIFWRTIARSCVFFKLSKSSSNNNYLNIPTARGSETENTYLHLRFNIQFSLEVHTQMFQNSFPNVQLCDSLSLVSGNVTEFI